MLFPRHTWLRWNPSVVPERVNVGYTLSSRAASATQQDNLWTSGKAHHVKVLAVQPGYLNWNPKQLHGRGKELFQLSCGLCIHKRYMQTHKYKQSKFKKNILGVISHTLSTILFPLFLSSSPYGWGIWTSWTERCPGSESMPLGIKPRTVLATNKTTEALT